MTISSKESIAIRDIFRRAGLARDSILIVHSSFRRLGSNGFRVDPFLEALLGAIPRGTLLMPAMTWRTVTPSNPYFDEISTPSHTGILAERFRVQHATSRSLHPTHSTAAYGKFGIRIVSGHELDTTPCSVNSPFAKIIDADGFVLLLGVGLESCTLIHCAEEVVEPATYLRADIEVYNCRDRFGAEHTVKTRRHFRLNRDFGRFSDFLKDKNALTSGFIEETPWLCFNARILYEVVLTEFRHNKFATLKDGASPQMQGAIGESRYGA